MFRQGWRNLSDALSWSPVFTAGMIVVSIVLAVAFGAYLTPPTNVSAVPFVIPIVFALFQSERWVWATSTIVILIYIPLAFFLESVALSSALINLLGLILFGLLFSRVADQRQRLRRHVAALERMEEDLRFTMRNSNVRVFSQDNDLRYTWVPNPLPTFPREQMIGARDEDLFPPEVARELVAIKRQALEKEHEIHRELEIARDGESRIIRLTAVPTFTGAEGFQEKTGVTCVSVDLTELHRTIRERDCLLQQQEQALAEAARAQRNLEAFASLVAHDLRQPLTVMQGYSGLLRRQLGETLDEEQCRALNALDRSIRQMKRLVDDLKDVAAMQQGRFTVNTEHVDLVAVVREVISDYESTTEGSKIKLEAPDVVEGLLDSSRISQLVGNLLSNAIKYSSGGEIFVKVDLEEHGCSLQVQDNGVGIAPDDREIMFELFSRLENARSIQGLGLGLYISKAIAEAHGGAIEVESVPGEGSTFTVRIPLTSPVATKCSEPG